MARLLKKRPERKAKRVAKRQERTSVLDRIEDLEAHLAEFRGGFVSAIGELDRKLKALVEMVDSLEKHMTAKDESAPRL